MEQWLSGCCSIYFFVSGYSDSLDSSKNLLLQIGEAFPFFFASTAAATGISVWRERLSLTIGVNLNQEMTVPICDLVLVNVVCGYSSDSIKTTTYSTELLKILYNSMISEIKILTL